MAEKRRPFDKQVVDIPPSESHRGVGDFDVSFDEKIVWPLTDEWRHTMRSTRKRLRVTQCDLARKLGVPQSTISTIETGHVSSSNLVPRISSMLSIAVPLPSEPLDRWFALGSLMRQYDRNAFGSLLKTVEKLIRKMEKRR